MQLGKKRFRKWVESHAADEVIGTSCRFDACPIASYLKETQGVQDPLVQRTQYGERYKLDGGMKSMPKWATRFIHAIDNTQTSRLEDGRFVMNKVAIRTSRALDVLNSIAD